MKPTNFHVISVKLNYWISCFDKKKKCSKNVIRKETLSFDVGNLQQIVWRNFRLWNFCIGNHKSFEFYNIINQSQYFEVLLEFCEKKKSLS
jgi:hypothetical protein